MTEIAWVTEVYRDTGVMQMDWAKGSIYLGDHRVDWSDLIISLFNKYTLCLPQLLPLTPWFSDFVNLCNCVDPHGGVVSNLHNHFPHSSSQNHIFSQMPIGCPEWCGGVLMMCISKMYFSLWKTPEVSERMWSVNLDAWISEEYQTVGGHSGRPSE